MAKDAVIMRSKQTICDILGLVMDIDTEMRLNRFVVAYQRGQFNEPPPSAVAGWQEKSERYATAEKG
jgi:hypothetical protein